MLIFGAALLRAQPTTAIDKSAWQTVFGLTLRRNCGLAANISGNSINLAVKNTTSNSDPVPKAISASANWAIGWQRVSSIAGYAGRKAVAAVGTLLFSGAHSVAANGSVFTRRSPDHQATLAQSDLWSGLARQLTSMNLTTVGSGACCLCGAAQTAGETRSTVFWVDGLSLPRLPASDQYESRERRDASVFVMQSAMALPLPT
jgi:hypothetical protein